MRTFSRALVVLVVLAQPVFAQRHGGGRAGGGGHIPAHGPSAKVEGQHPSDKAGHVWRSRFFIAFERPR
jgi:hypothetical protein